MLSVESSPFMPAVPGALEFGNYGLMSLREGTEKAMAPHSSTLA